MFDVHVIGGGPAGLFAGIAALQEGKKVLLSEEHRSIGEPEACSGLISKSGLDSLRPYIDYNEAVINEINSAKFLFGRREFTVLPKKETALLVSRSILDSIAADRFEKEGGKLELGMKVTRGFQAKSIIGADGPASFVADFFGFPKIRHFISAMQGDFHYACENPHQAQIFVSSREFPGFFGWVIPKSESEAKIGLGVSQPNHPLSHYRNFIARLGVKTKPTREFAAVIPVEARKRTAMEKADRCILLAGDSAGQVKATTGGGVFFGANCGLLAGKHSCQPEKYEQAWRSKFGLDLSLHGRIRALLNLNGGQPPAAGVSLAKSLFFEDLLSEEGKMDRLSGMLSPSIISSYASIMAKRISGGKK